MAKPLTDAEIAELRQLGAGGEETALEWRAAVLAAHPFLLDEVERARRARAMLPPIARGDRVTLDRRDYDEIRKLLGA